VTKTRGRPQALGVREPNDFDDAFAAMDREPPEAILMVSDSLTLLNRKRVIDYAAEHRLPAIYEQDFVTRDGGLMSYGTLAALHIVIWRRIPGFDTGFIWKSVQRYLPA